MKKIVLDLSGAMTREDIHSRFAQRLSFPEWYGKNLDALYDCLTDIREDTCIGIYGMPSGEEMTAYWRRVFRTCEEAEEENPHLCFFYPPMAEDDDRKGSTE